MRSKKQSRTKRTRTRNSVHPSLKSIVRFSFGKKRPKKKAQKKRSTKHKGPNPTHKRPTWIASVQKARSQLGVKGFLAVGGKSQKGQQLLKLARQIYKH